MEVSIDHWNDLSHIFSDLKEMATGIVDKWMKKIRGDTGSASHSNGGM